jgi:hypothetical protein
MTTRTQAQQDFLDQAEFFRGTFEDQYNIPTAGRSPYQQWLSNQWQIPATEFSLSSALSPSPKGVPQTFQNYLFGRRQAEQTSPERGRSPLRINPIFLDQITQRAPQAQRELLENLPDYVGSTAFYGALQNRYPNFIAQGLTSQAFGAPQRRAFDISKAAIEGDSFLNFVRQRYGI